MYPLTTVCLLGLVTSFNYKTEKIRGVNLGGWLVLEPWITPSLFEPFRYAAPEDMAIDEYTFTKILGKDEAKQQLENHWSTWVTEDDFSALKEAGINHVRIPVGYWAFNRTDDEPWVDGSREHLIRGVNLAKKYQINVMIDIHAAPLSQNGFDNSGKAGKVEFLSDDTSGPRMLDVLRKVTDLFSTREFKETVTAIELVNEPANSLLDFEKLKAFYEDGYKVIRKRSKGVMVTFHDAFCSLEEWEYLSSKSNILLDTHIYNAFDLRFLTFTHNDHKEHTCTFVKQLSRSNSLMPTVVGEWSLATTDCTLYLNGFRKGSRFAGTFVDHASPPLPPDYDFKNDDCAIHDDLASFTQEHQLWLAEFFIHQMSVYENAGSGWFFWNFKAENSPEWNFLLGVREGWIKIPDSTHDPCM